MQVTTCDLDDAALVLVTPPRATAILDAATPGATPPLLVSDAVQIWLDGRDWTGEAEGDSSGGPDVRTQDVAARSRAAAAAAVEALRPLLAPSRRR